MVILLSILILIEVVTCQNSSPCPDVFKYEKRTNEEDRWYGVVQLKTSEDLTGVFVHIILDRPADLLGNWFGESTTKDNMDFTIQNMTYKLQPGPPVVVRFFVKYNQARTIPSVSVIRLNGRTICPARGGDEGGPATPKLHISRPKPTQSNGGSGERRDRPTSLSSGANGGNNRPSNNNYNRPTERPGFNRASTEDYSSNSRSTLRPTGNSALNVDDETPSSHDFFQGDFGILKQNKPVGSRPVQHGSRNSGCGVVASRANPLIAYGQETKPGDWPWHAALYHSTGTELKYTCGGTLVAPQYVVTAAHCVTKPGTNNGVDPQYMLVYMGKHSLMAFGADVQDKTIARIYVHPEYNYSVFFNDIAILKLSSPFEITNFVRICCLWEEDIELEEIIGRKGVVVGWGYDERRILSSFLMKAEMPVVSTVQCIYSKRDFFSQFTFEKNFCAGFRNGTSVCNGDSGSGMFFQKKRSGNENPVWQLRGLVSVGVALQGSGICDASQYVVFTDAAKYTGWIRRIIGSEN